MKSILNHKVGASIGYWVFISICIMGPANCAVFGVIVVKLTKIKRIKLKSSWRLCKTFYLHVQSTLSYWNFWVDSGKWEEWTRQLKCENKDKTLQKLSDSDKVCSKHLIDGEPTAAQPFPEIKHGSRKKVSQIRRHIRKHLFLLKKLRNMLLKK